MKHQSKILLNLFILMALNESTALAKPMRHKNKLTLEQKLNKLIEENEKLKGQLHQLQHDFVSYKQTQPVHAHILPAIPALAPKPVVERGPMNKLKVTLEGQVNRAIAYADSGRRSELKHLDNNASSTRLTFKSEGNFHPQLKLGTVIEGELTGNNTKNKDIGDATSTTTIQERKLEAYVQHAKYGQLWMGQGETAAHRVSDVDLSGTQAVNEGAEFESLSGGIKFVKGSVAEGIGTQADRDRAISQVYYEVFGSSRKNRLKYVTPCYKGLTFEVSHAMRDYSDMAIRYAQEINGVKVAAAVGYTSNPFNTNISGISQISSKFGRKDYGGSLALLFKSGISLRGGYAKRVYDISNRNDGQAWSAKLGYQRNFFNIGKTFMAVAYGEGKALFESNPTTSTAKDTPASAFLEDNSEKIKIMGAYFVQEIKNLSTEAYLGYQFHKLSRDAYNPATGARQADYNFKNIHAVVMGARVKF